MVPMSLDRLDYAYSRGYQQKYDEAYVHHWNVPAL